jgi:hypothetical protein
MTDEVRVILGIIRLIAEAMPDENPCKIEVKRELHSLLCCDDLWHYHKWEL